MMSENEFNIDLTTELKAYFFGREADYDEAIIQFVRKTNLCNFAQISNKLCYQYGLLSERRLRVRISQLLKYGILFSRFVEGIVFYTVNPPDYLVKNEDKKEECSSSVGRRVCEKDEKILSDEEDVLGKNIDAKTSSSSKSVILTDEIFFSHNIPACIQKYIDVTFLNNFFCRTCRKNSSFTVQRVKVIDSSKGMLFAVTLTCEEGHTFCRLVKKLKEDDIRLIPK